MKYLRRIRYIQDFPAHVQQKLSSVLYYTSYALQEEISFTDNSVEFYN